MEFKASSDVKITIVKEDVEVTFKVLDEDKSEIYKKLTQYDKDLKVEVKEFREKRTNDQNSYFWALVREVADKMGRTMLDTYKDYIQDCGVFEIVPIKDEAVKQFIRKWESKGLGWFCKDMGYSKMKGYTKLAVYFGSSSYNTKEMERLIDAVLDDCEELGIMTKTKEQIMQMDNDVDEIEAMQDANEQEANEE